MNERYAIPNNIDLDRVKSLTEREASHLTSDARNAVLDIIQGGKYFRPIFLLLAAEENNEIPDNAYSAAAGIELVHLSSLIHDDIIYKATMRRGVACLHKAVGIEQALPVGNFLSTRGFRILHEKISPEALPSIFRAAEAICLGELRQNEMVGKNILVTKYIENVRTKTGILYAEALTCGSDFFGEDAEINKLLHDAGLAFGIFYQIMADVQDLKGETCVKDPSSDKKHGIQTLPLLYAEIPPLALKILPNTILSKISLRRGGCGKAINKAMGYRDECIGYLDKIIEQNPERTGIIKLKKLINSI